MTTTVTLTGTGIPNPHPDRAGAGVLIETQGFSLQFDAGRATSMRLARLGIDPARLDVVFLTHHHSDHLQGLDDLAFARWVRLRRPPTGDQDADAKHLAAVPLPVIGPDGPLRTLVESLLDPWEPDFAVRRRNNNIDYSPAIAAQFFEVANDRHLVWERDAVSVWAAPVRHEPVVPAVGYRIETPDGAIVFSGDTAACDEMRALSQGADVLVHEAMLSSAIAGTTLDSVVKYHTDAEAVGALARDAGISTLMLTHLIPAPDQLDDGERRYEEAVRRGGFKRDLIVGVDGSTVSI